MRFITLIAEPNYSPKAIATYKELGEVYFWFDLSEAEKAAILPRADILAVRLALTVDRQLLDKMPALKVIATSTTGLNHIDTAYAENKGIEIISLRGRTEFLEKIPSTAEETMGLIIALLRNLPWAFEDVKNGHWNTNQWVGHQLSGKTLGIFGLGRLGKLVAGYALAFGMKVVAADPYVDEKDMAKLGVTKVAMEDLFKTADVVSLHVLLQDDTRELIKAKHLQSMKPSSYLINTARAELIERGLLEKALKEKWIAGAAADVLWDEKDDNSHLKNNPLIEYAQENQNLLIVPHIGGTTYEAKEITQDFIADLAKKHLHK